MSINESGHSASLPISMGPSSALTRRHSAPIPIHPVPAKDSVAISDPVKSYLKYGRHGDIAVAERRALAVQHRVANHYEDIEPEVRNQLAQAAIDNEEIGLIQALGQAGYDFNAGNTLLGNFDTHLTHAISENKPKAVRALLAAGANVNQRPRYGNAPIRTAIYQAEHDRKYKPLQAMLEARSILSEDLVERVQSLLTVDDSQLKPLLAKSLLTAVKDDNQSLITYLLETVKLDPNVSVGNTNAATVAAVNNRWKTAERFEKLGVINHFRERVARFGYEMVHAKNGAEKATALANLLSGKYFAPEPDDTPASETEKGETQFDME